MATPKKYLSFSQLTKWEMSPDRYAEQYLYGEKQRISRNMAYGKQLADSLETGELSGDLLLDFAALKLPKFEIMDQPIEDPKGVEIFYERDERYIHVPFLRDKNEKIPILAIPDSMKSDGSAFKEFKTSTRKWTQRMVDESGQITFYATAFWLKNQYIPNDIELVAMQTEYKDDGQLAITGDMNRFPTIRRMSDVIKMTLRIRHAWYGIKKLCEKELL